MSVPLPPDEAGRLRALERYGVLDTPAEPGFDDIVRLAAYICQAPIALISLIDRDRQWFKARVGLEEAQTPREQAFCAHAILKPGEVMVVKDATADRRFRANPLVTGKPDIRFYAGSPLVTPGGQALGTLCVIDRTARELRPDQLDALAALSRQVVTLLELRRATAELQALSVTDGLTGAGNRRAFDLALDQELRRALRKGEPVSLLLLDIDHFKSYNDAFGHPAGDEALRRFAAVLLGIARPYDFVARYGGEEFGVILPGADGKSAAMIGERVRAAVEAAQWPHRAITCSVGVATSLGIGAAELTAAADTALYQAKRGGRNRVVRHQA